MKAKHNTIGQRAIRLALPMLVAIAALSVVLIFGKNEGVEALIEHNYLDTLAILPSLALLLLLGLIVQIDRPLRADLKRTMRLIILLAFSLVAQNYAEYRIASGAPRVLLRTAVSIYGYAARPTILALFMKIVVPDRRYRWAWALVLVNALMFCTALFSGLTFQIDGNNRYFGGPLSNLCLYVSVILLACLFALTLLVFEPRKRRETWVPIVALALILISVAMDYNIGAMPQPISYLTIAIVISCVAYYIWLHLQFVREHEEAMEAGQRLQLALSQIKPHFLYNTLNTISELCDEDPQTAKFAVYKFANYLRGNMNSIDQTGAIPFRQELEHTRSYLEIEQLRFEDALQVRYDTETTDFRIPALTLEPLVENAVRHGVRGNDDGRGTVTISTRDMGDAVQVVIEDDGPGFDVNALPDDGKTHVGIANVRERLASVCGGTLEIRSVPCKGTEAIITVPKEEIC